jgi:mono/diheme cytochrome c family protein
VIVRALLAATALALVAAMACAQDAENLKDPKMIAVGHELFLEKQCAHCHGEDGKGGVNLARRILDPADVFQSIANGREKNGIRMPAWRDVLTDDQIRQATAYVMSISHQPE